MIPLETLETIFMNVLMIGMITCLSVAFLCGIAMVLYHTIKMLFQNERGDTN